MRAIWTGAVSFGLVNIPVKLYSASEDTSLDLDMLDKRDHARIRYKRVNENTGEEVEWGNIVKGFKTEKGYVVLNDEDFEQASVKKSKTVDIDEFVPQEQISDLLYKKPYYLEPQKGGEKAYNLLREALQKSKKVGVATFVMRRKEHLALLDAHENYLVLHVIRFSEELRDPEELKLPEEKTGKQELEMAMKLIEQFSSDFELNEYKDDYRDALLRIIEARSKGKKLKAVDWKAEPTEARDLMEKLRQSLEMKKAS